MVFHHKLVYSLGTSTRSAEEFIRLLNRYEIGLVVDVRRFPVSRFEHFNQSELVGILAGRGIEYLYLGDRLGGYRKGGYVAFASTEEFSKGMEALEAAVSGNVAAVVCAEKLPWRCHRRFIAAELGRRGWDVIHIIDEERVWIPREGSPTT